MDRNAGVSGSSTSAGIALMSGGGFRPYIKALLWYGFFLVMVGMYRAFPVFPLSLICGVNESVFQHMKTAFFCVLIIDLVEFLIFRKRIMDRQQFWYPQLMGAVFVPWLIFLFWYIAPAVYGRWSTNVLEALYANVMTIIVMFVLATLEQGFTQIRFAKSLKALILAIVVILTGLCIIFTFKLPWADVFVEPDWKEGSFLIRPYLYLSHL